MHAAATGQFNRGLVAVVARVKDDHFIAGMNHGLDRAENGLGRTGRDRHLGISIHLDPVTAYDFCRYLLAQGRQTGHG
jgi:hypothetical protein